jgi:hypothetical protein
VLLIAKKGGDFLLGTKHNTPKRHEVVVNALRATPFSP